MKILRRSCIAAMAAAVLLCGCDGGGEHARCMCRPRNHLGMGELCGCGADSGRELFPCEEQVAVIGDMPFLVGPCMVRKVEAVYVRKQPGIGAAEMDAAVADVIRPAFNPLGNYEKVYFTNRVREIHIVPGDAVGMEGAVMSVGHGANSAAFADFIAAGGLLDPLPAPPP